MPQAGAAKAGRTWKWAVSAAGLIAIVAALFLISVLSPMPDLVPSFSVHYDYGSSAAIPIVVIRGCVYNNGTEATGCSLNITIKDSRGWSLTDNLDLGVIEPKGGFALVDKTYAWPIEYNGVVVDTPTPLVPELTYTVSQY